MLRRVTGRRLPEKQVRVLESLWARCGNGDLRAVWYENGEEMPPPYYSENKDKSDDVRIGGAVEQLEQRAVDLGDRLAKLRQLFGGAVLGVVLCQAS